MVPAIIMQPLYMSLILLALGTNAAGATTTAGGPSLCPDGEKPDQIGGASTDQSSSTYICCPGHLFVAGDAASDVTCSVGCDPLTETICGSTTYTTPVFASATVTTDTSGITAAPSAACSGSSCPAPLPPGCSTSVNYEMTTGVCSVVPWTLSNYLSQVYGTAAGTATFGGPPSTGVAPRVTERPVAALVAGALAGVIML